MGTAPRNPTHEMYSFPFVEKLRKGSKQRNTEMGRAKIIMNIPTVSPIPATGSSSWGLTSKPSMMNMAICQSHVNPSKKVPILFLCTILAFPTTNPAI